jgi:hypothetical protein
MLQCNFPKEGIRHRRGFQCPFCARNAENADFCARTGPNSLSVGAAFKRKANSLTASSTGH